MPTRRRAPIRKSLAVATLLVLAFSLAVPVGFGREYRRGVDIRDFAFSPRTVEVRVGDSVRWTNRDSVAHTATARNGSFDTGLLGDGESGSVQFTSAGTYRYVCTPHPDMTGTVVVRAAGTIVPPNTTTAAIADESGAGSGTADALVALLAGIGALAFLLPERLLRRRRSSP